MRPSENVEKEQNTKRTSHGQSEKAKAEKDRTSSRALPEHQLTTRFPQSKKGEYKSMRSRFAFRNLILLTLFLCQSGVIFSQAPQPTPSQSPEISQGAGSKVKLYFLREATKIVAILNAIEKAEGSEIKGLTIGNVGDDEIILYGPSKKRDAARRIIAVLDLPRPGITMDMWGIQISSRNPDSLAKAMREIREVIDRTQQDVRSTYDRLQTIARNVAANKNGLDPAFRSLLEDDLSYRYALDGNRPLSLTDILLIMIAAKDPRATVDAMIPTLDDIAYKQHQKFTEWQQARKNQKCKVEFPSRRAFERFLQSRGASDGVQGWDTTSVNTSALQGRKAVLDFALNYAQLVHNPEGFSPYYLQQSADALNSRVQKAIDALNFDMQELFVVPTLVKIQTIVCGYDDVEYAQVGKTSVASLNGTATEVASYSVNAFDATPPLRLSELLKTADTLSKSVGTFVPTPTKNLVGEMPLSQVIGLIGAFGEERSVWRELRAGVSLTITPNVLRNMTSAELQLQLKTGDPQAGTREQGVPPLSRVSQHDVKTNVYVNAMDFFDISSFGNETTVSGGRGYVPVVGPVWRGLFGEIPVFGKLLSWKRKPQTVYNESLVLTTSFITPTVMGVAVLYPTGDENTPSKLVGRTDQRTEAFKVLREKVKSYKDSIP